MARWKNPREVADYFGISESKINTDISKEQGLGKFFYRIDKCRRADLDEIEAFLKESK